MKKPTSRARNTGKRTTSRVERDTLRPEYDFRGGVRGKHARRFADGTNLVLLDPDVAAEFDDARAVNRALRAYLKERAKRRTA
jgi:hypothetical protein